MIKENESETTHSRGKYVKIFECCEWKLVLFFPAMLFSDIQLLLIKFKFIFTSCETTWLTLDSRIWQ